MSNLVSYLFSTSAMKIFPEKKPFWYTSGKIGPYYINTHFLYGNEEDATNLLKFIDVEKENKLEMPIKLYEKIYNQYQTDKLYKDVALTIKNFIESNINVNEIDYISGGERRDWFFSYIIAKLLNKPHITIYKDLTTVVSNLDFTETQYLTKLEGKKVLHVADLVTEASSYIRAWIPAIQNLGSSIVWSTAVVDRMQGGSDKLKELGIEPLSIIKVDNSLFKQAFELNIINKNQLDMLENFIKSPDKTMEKFLKENPNFIKDSLNSDSKTASRAKLCLDSNFYEF